MNRDLIVDWMDWRVRRSGAGRVGGMTLACDAGIDSGMRSVDEDDGGPSEDGWRSGGAAFSLLLLEGTVFVSWKKEEVGFRYCG